MERINPFAFYELGKALRAVAAYHGDVRPASVFIDLWTAQSVLEKALKGDPFPLGVSRSAAERLQEDINEIKEAHFSVEMPNGGREFRFPDSDAKPIPVWRFNIWRQHLESFETVLSAEMSHATTYYVPRRGIYDTPSLVDAAETAFPKVLRPYIPQKTAVDWRAAGRCLAFNLCTASGFHVVRAVEGTLETYYQKFAGKPGKTLGSWHDYLKVLDAVSSDTVPRPDPKTLAALRQLKDDYRNPVVHPRVELSEVDARVLFDNGESAILGMAQGLREAIGGVQPSLSLASVASEGD